MPSHYVTVARSAISMERDDQRRRGFTAERDDGYTEHQLGKAGACYLASAKGIGPQPVALGGNPVPAQWPWDAKWWKPRSAEQDLIRAGALFSAERDRLMRTAPSQKRSRALFEYDIMFNDAIAALALIYRASADDRMSIAIEGNPSLGHPAAPKDGTMVWLLVDYRGEDGDHPLDDAEFAWTIGFNNLDNDGEDVWKFAGWCWSHDHFNEGRGKVLAWKPLGFELTPPACFQPRSVDADSVAA